MRRVLILLVLAIVLLSICGCGSPKILTVKSNLDAAKVAPDMVYDKDFTVDSDYMDTFVKVVECTRLSQAGGSLSYRTPEGAEYAPYFMWICYPQLSKSSQVTILAMEDVGGSLQKSGTFTVMFVARHDTQNSLTAFGGTYGTSKNGW